MSKRRTPSAEDVALFREAVGQVSPIKHDRQAPATRPPAPVAHQKLRDEQVALQELLSAERDPAHWETGEELLFLRPGLRGNVLRNLRRGHYVVGAELDLHGLSAAQAREAVGAFLTDCRNQGQRCVRIIHGKGHRSSNQGPVIKPLLNRWLRLRDEVLGFCSARPVDGGTGALYVLLRKR